MKLIEIYKSLKSGEITEDEAAKRLNVSVKELRFRLNRYGSRTAQFFQVLDKIKSDKISRSEASEALEISARQVNQLMNTWNVKRPLKDYLVHRTGTQVKWEIRRKYAIDFIGENCTIQKAAEQADVSTRQMRRWVSDLLKKHYDMQYKELGQLTLTRRRRLADEIETAEGLEIEKQKVVDEVASGSRTIEDVAMERLMAKRTRGNQDVRRRAE